MLSSGSFGALGMDESSEAGPSRRQVDGDEVDADVSLRDASALGSRLKPMSQWIKLIKTNHDVNVRVSDRVDLAGLPQECNLMVVSNSYDLLVVGGNQGVSASRGRKNIAESPRCPDTSPVGSPQAAGRLAEGCLANINTSSDLVAVCPADMDQVSSGCSDRIS